MPTAFLPDEDQGYLIVSAQLPDGASKERTDAVMQQDLDDRQARLPGVDHVVTVSGISILDNCASLANAGVAFVVLNDWDVRLKQKGQDLRSIYRHLNGVPARRARGASRSRSLPPPIQGIGNVGGFSMQVEIKNGDFDYALLQSLTNAVVRDGNAQSALQRVEHDLPGRRAPAHRHGRPHQGRDARHYGRQRLFRPVGLCRIELRRAVQQVRTCVPGLHAGAARLPGERRRHPRTSRSRRATEP